MSNKMNASDFADVFDLCRKPWNFYDKVTEFIKANKSVLFISHPDIDLNRYFRVDKENCDYLYEGEHTDLSDKYDLVINLNCRYKLSQIDVILKRGGYYITEQAASGDISRSRSKIAGYNLENEIVKFQNEGKFNIEYRNQYYTYLPMNKGICELYNRFIIIVRKR
jgi:hypothetical protein